MISERDGISAAYYALITRPGNRMLRFLAPSCPSRGTGIGRNSRASGAGGAGMLTVSSSRIGDRIMLAARRARSARLSTPNLLKSVEMWNFTVRTVIFSFEAISLFSRLHITE